MKNKLSLYLITLLCLSYCEAQNISITNGNVKVGKTKISSEWKLDEFKKAFGPKSGYVDGFTNVHHLENAGVLLYEDGTTDLVNAVTLFMFETGKEDQKTVGVYKGVVKIDGKVIPINTTPEAITGLLTNWKSAKTYGEHVYRFKSDDKYIYFYFSEDEKTLTKINFGISKT